MSDQELSMDSLNGGSTKLPGISGDAMAAAVEAKERGPGLLGIENAKGESVAVKAAEVLRVLGKLSAKSRDDLWALSTAVLVSHSPIAVALAFFRMCPPGSKEMKVLENAFPEVRELIKLKAHGIATGLTNATEDEKAEDSDG